MIKPNGLHFFLFLSSIPFFITGFIGNVLVIHIVHKTREMHTPTNYLLANMAVSDVVSVMLLPLYYVVQYQLGSVNNNFEKFTCKSVALVQICITVSSTTLTLIAVERYHALLKPFRTELRLSGDNVKKAIAIIWIISVLLSLPSFFLHKWNIEEDAVERFACVGPWTLRMNQASKIYLLVNASIFFIQLTTMCYCYASLIKGLYFSNTLCPEETEGERGSEREKLVLTFLLATTGFLIGYAPGILFYTIVASRDIQQEDLLLYSVLRAVLDFLFNCSLCLNPIFYAFRSAHFKEGFKRLLKCQEPTSQNEIQLGA